MNSVCLSWITERTRKGTCKVSIEGPSERHCEHEALTNRNFLEFFRFDLLLIDDSLRANYGKTTLKSAIWEAAGDLLDISAPTLASMNDLDQLQYVHDKISLNPTCKLTFRVQRGVVSI